MTESLLPVSKVLELTGHSRSGLYGAIRAGEYPAPVKRGRRSFWVKSELIKAIEAEKEQCGMSKTREQMLQRIGEHSVKWVQLEAEKAKARTANVWAWECLRIIVDDSISAIVQRGRDGYGMRGYFWTEHALQAPDGGQPGTRADADPRVQRAAQTWAAYSKAKIAAGNARAVVTKAVNRFNKTYPQPARSAA